MIREYGYGRESFGEGVVIVRRGSNRNMIEGMQGVKISVDKSFDFEDMHQWKM